MKTKLSNLVLRTISGEWGYDKDEFPKYGIIRSSNFNEDGTINFENITERSILKERKENDEIKYTEDTDKIELKKLIDDDIIIEKSGGGPNTPVGRVVFFTNNTNKIYLSSNFTQIIRIDRVKVYPKYIFHYFQYLYNTKRVLKYQNQTTGLINLKVDRFLQEELEIPNRDKQLNIITLLKLIRDIIEKKKKNFSLLEDLLKSIFFEMFGDPVSNPKKFKTISLSNKKFKISSGFTPSRSESKYYKGSIPWAKSSDVNGEIILETEEYISHESIKNTGAKIFPKGSVLIAMYGQGRTRGRVAILGVDSSCNQACAVITPNDFSEAFLFSIIYYSYDFIRTLSKGGGRENLSLEIIKRIKIINPDKDKQLNYEKKFYTINNKRVLIRESIKKLEKLYDSVLYNAFNESSKINEESIFDSLIMEFSINDLKNNKERLQYLINLFSENKLKDTTSYNNAKNKLFELLDNGVLVQSFDDNNIKIDVK